MKNNWLIRCGSMILASAVLVTGVWYTEKETGEQTIPLVVEYIDTDDGRVVVPPENIPTTTKPVVKVTKSTKKSVKKSTLKKKASKTAKTTKRSRKTKTVKKENTKQKVTTDTSILTTVVTATKKNSKVQTVTTTVETTVKTTTTTKPAAASTSASTANRTSTTNRTTTASTASSGGAMQTVSTVRVRSIAPKANANVLKAFETLEFKIEINPTYSYSGYFSVKSHNIVLKKSSGDVIYHELGHFVGWLAGNVDTSSEFTAIYNKEKGALSSANYQYYTKSSAEYFAESYREYILTPQNLKSKRPQTYAFIQKSLNKITDARVANIRTAYMRTYWS